LCLGVENRPEDVDYVKIFRMIVIAMFNNDNYIEFDMIIIIVKLSTLLLSRLVAYKAVPDGTVSNIRS